ncbi:MAG: hypothetical protein ACI4QT_05015 [Kiritimatiellia bacterium]
MKKIDIKRSGQAMVEYIIIVVVIAVAALALFGLLGDTIKEKTSGAVSSLTSSDLASEAQSQADQSSVDTFKEMDSTGL